MTTYRSLYQLTSEGLRLYELVMTRQIAEEVLEIANPLHATPVAGTRSFEVKDFKTAKEMAVAVCAAFDKLDPQESASNTGLWAWLTFVMIDVIFPLTKAVREFKAYYRWYPSPPNEYDVAQRHLVRMPVLLYAAFGDDADHMICGKPYIGPEIREQLTSQQDMFTLNFQRACRALYYDEKAARVKRGVSSKKLPGTSRRLAAVRKQLDVTWDMTDLSSERILELLPAEFSQFLESRAAQ
ncbi:hypothetical protein [Devosia sp.]|uniref:hypothetical protein n=1 Tax=Devosia sp. TaxID=1871048 RepID=UPI003BAD6CC5